MRSFHQIPDLGEVEQRRPPVEGHAPHGERPADYPHDLGGGPAVRTEEKQWKRVHEAQRGGLADEADLQRAVLGAPPQRILMSYCLSMFTDKDRAIDNARRHLAPGGELWVVDFSDLAGLPSLPRRAMRRFLSAFHVEAVPDGLLHRHGASHVEHGPLRYFVVARLAASG